MQGLQAGLVFEEQAGEQVIFNDEDFPCGDSHSRIDWAQMSYGPNPKPEFINNRSGHLFGVTDQMVEEFKQELLEQVRVCDIWLAENGKKLSELD